MYLLSVRICIFFLNFKYTNLEKKMAKLLAKRKYFYRKKCFRFVICKSSNCVEKVSCIENNVMVFIIYTFLEKSNFLLIFRVNVFIISRN